MAALSSDYGGPGIISTRDSRAFGKVDGPVDSAPCAAGFGARQTEVAWAAPVGHIPSQAGTKEDPRRKCPGLMTQSPFHANWPRPGSLRPDAAAPCPRGAAGAPPSRGPGEGVFPVATPALWGVLRREGCRLHFEGSGVWAPLTSCPVRQCSPLYVGTKHPLQSLGTSQEHQAAGPLKQTPSGSIGGGGPGAGWG